MQIIADGINVPVIFRDTYPLCQAYLANNYKERQNPQQSCGKSASFGHFNGGV
jgi:hypothetical protein